METEIFPRVFPVGLTRQAQKWARGHEWVGSVSETADAFLVLIHLERHWEEVRDLLLRLEETDG